VRVGTYRLVDKADKPVAAATKDLKFPQSFSFAATASYLGSFSGQEVHLTTEPAGPLGGAVRCWEAGGITFCMWADNGTYGVFDYRPPLGLDTALIHHLAGVVPRFRKAMEQAQG
jgi:hypothetical protein